MSDLPAKASGTRLLAAWLIFWSCWRAVASQNVLIDQATDPGGSADAPVTSIALQQDGKLLVGGYFRRFGGQIHPGIVRILPSGQIDPDFQSSGVDGIQSAFNRQPAVLAIQLQPDGRILVAGEFTQFNGQPHTNLVRLLPDGSLDPSFRVAATVDRYGFSQPVFISSLQQTDDGKIYIGGQFRLEGKTPYESGNLIARLNSDGSEDSSFATGAFSGQTDSVRSVASFGGRLYLGGRLNATGLGIVENGLPVVSSPYYSYHDSKVVHALAVLPDGRIVGGGGFFWNGSPEPPVPWKARLGVVRADGYLEPLPGFEADGAVYAVVPEPSGSLLVGGSFRTVNGAIRGGIARFLPNQHLDRCFIPGPLISGSLSGQPSSIRSLVRAPDGGIWIAGDFTHVDGQKRNGLARLLDHSSCDSNVVAFASSRFVANESDSIATVVLIRRGQSNESVSVWFETGGGTATPGQDYRPVREKVVFAPGENSQVVEIPLIADAQPEGEQTIELRLLPDLGAEIRLGQSTLSIQEPDPRGTEWISSGSNLSSAMAEGFWIDPEGRLLISELDDGTVRRLVRQTAQGTVDPEWKPATIAGSVAACAFLTDGGIFIAGDFSSVNGHPRNGIAWMLPDGQLDPSVIGLKEGQFGPTVHGMWLHSAAPQLEGAVLLSGYFTVSGGTVNRTNLVRLLRNGQVDPEAYYPANPGTIVNLAAAPGLGAMVRDGDGWFRLLPTGRLDLEFRARTPGHAITYAMLALPDGRILTEAMDLESSEIRAVRLMPDGRIDPTFRPVSGFSIIEREPGSMVQLKGFAAAPNGPVLLWGYFDQVGNLPLSLLAPMSLDGRPDAWNTIKWPAIDKRAWGIAKAELRPQGDLIVLMEKRVPGEPFENLLWRFSPSPSSDPSVFSLRMPVQQVSETVGPLEVEIARTGDASLPATVHVDLEESGATFGEDLDATAGRLSFSPGERVKRLAIGIINDRNVEPAESFRIRITGVDGGLTGEPSGGTITIVDDDFAVEFDTDHRAATEREGRIDLPVRLVGVVPPLPLTVRFTARPGTATENSDYRPFEGEIRFESRFQNVQWLTLQIQDDAQPEPTEILQVNIEALDANAGVAGPGTLRITIIDDDSDHQGGLGIDGDVRVIQAQRDGKIVVAGDFERVNGELRPGVARLNPDGSLDHSFSTNFKPGARVQSLAQQQDGRILVSETFQIESGQLRSRLLRLMNDGGTDPSFTPVVAAHAPGTFNPTRSPIRAVAVLPSGSILIGGSFDEIAGAPRIGLARIRSNGSLDGSFQFNIVGHPNWGGGEINTFASTHSGQLVAGGFFASVGGAGRNGMLLLSANGIPDTTFSPQLTGAMVTPIGSPSEAWESPNRVEAIRILSDSTWIIYRSEGTGGGWGFPVEYPFGRMLTGRVRDRRFDNNLPYVLMEGRATITCVETVPGNKILIGMNNTLIRLNNDGTEDRTFSAPIVDWPSIVGLEPQGQGQFRTAMATDNRTLWLGGSFRRLGVTLQPRLATLPFNGRNPEPASFFPPQPIPDGRVVLMADTEASKPVTWEVSWTPPQWTAASGWGSGVDHRIFIPDLPKTNSFYRFYVP